MTAKQLRNQAEIRPCPCRRGRIILFIWLAIFGTFLHAQTAGVLRFQHLQVSQPVFSGVYRDSKGFVWISTVENLYRFDGLSTKIYGHSEGLNNRNIQTKVFEDERSNLWLCTPQAMYCYFRHKDRLVQFRLYNHSTGKTLENNYKIQFLDRQYDRLLVKVSNNLYWFDIKAATSAYLAGGLSSTLEQAWTTSLQHAPCRKVFPLQYPYHGRPDRLAFIHDDGSLSIGYFKENQQVIEETIFAGKDAASPKAEIKALAQTPDGILWLISNIGLIKWNPAATTNKAKIHGEHLNLTAIAVWPETEKIWLGTKNEGLLLFNAAETVWNYEQNYRYDATNPYSLSGLAIHQLYLDDEKNLWVPVLSAALDFVNLGKQRLNPTPVRQPDGAEFVTDCISMGSNGDLWCASKKNGLCRLKPQTGEIFQIQKNQIRSCLQTLSLPDGTVLVSNLNGKLMALEASGKLSQVNRASSPGDTANAAYLLKCRNGRILAGKQSTNGLWEIRKTGQQWLAHDIQSNALNKYLWGRLYEDHSGVLYADFSNGSGIQAFDSDYNLLREIPLPHNGEVRAYAECDSCVWIGGDFGLLSVNKNTGQLHKWGIKDSFPEEHGICGLLFEQKKTGQSCLWGSIGSGVFCYSLDDRNINFFDYLDGLQGKIFSPGAYLSASNGQYLFGGVNGLNVFNPEALKALSTDARPYIRNIQVNGESYNPALNVEETTEMYLASHQNNIIIEAGAIEFAAPQHNKLFYRLEKSENWYTRPLIFLKNLVFEEHSATTMEQWLGFNGPTGTLALQELSPGNYTLLLKAENSDGIQGEIVRKLTIRIKPPFWQTWWFSLFLLMLFLGLSWLYSRYQLYKLGVKSERERESQRQRADLETKALRAQMKTHFIKNILTSIESYIWTASNTDASRYLIQCSELMDKIFQHSIHSSLTLSMELDVLKDYIELGAIGWRNELEYVVKLDETSVDPDQVRIPTLLLQPFVENALTHGLRTKTGPKKLTINIFRNDHGDLICQIIDNGIGREAAALKNRDNSQYNAKGLHAIQVAKDRLNLYRLEFNAAGKIKIEDLTDSSEMPAGTLVEIELGKPTSTI